MSDINENMGPVQDRYTQTYVSQYVPMPFEIMQKKAEREQKEFDTIQDNWEVISAKMGEKVLDVDKPLMQEQVTEYQNIIDDALKQANGDWRKLSGTVKGVASKYRNFITTGEGAKAVARLAEMNQKIKNIDESDLSGRMKRAQKNWIQGKYRAEGGVRGNEDNPDGATIENEILYDESKLADTLVDWISKLKPNKGDKIQAYKDPKDGKIKYAATGAWTSYSDEELGKIVSKSTTQKGVDLQRIREVASGVYGLPDFQDAVDAEMMVGWNKNMNVPLRDAAGNILKKDGEIQYEKRDLTRDEYQQLKFAKQFGFADAFAYMEEETKYKLASDEKAAAERKRKKEQAKKYKEQGIIATTTTPVEAKGSWVKENEDADDAYKKLVDQTAKGNKEFMFDYTDKGQIYNTFKNNFINQGRESNEDADVRKDFDDRLLKIFQEDDELSSLLETVDGKMQVSGAGINELFKRVAEGDEDFLNKLTVTDKNQDLSSKLFYSKKDAEAFKKIAIERDRITYLNERRLKENTEEVYRKGLLLTEGGLKELKQDVDNISNKYVKTTKGMITNGLQKVINRRDFKTEAEYNTAIKEQQDLIDFTTQYLTYEVAGTGKIHLNGKQGRQIFEYVNLINETRSLIEDSFEESEAEDKMGGAEFEKDWNENKAEFKQNPKQNAFITNLGGGDFEAGYSKLRDVLVGLSEYNTKYETLSNKQTQMEEAMENKNKIFQSALEEKLEKRASISLNQSTGIELVQTDANEIAKGAPENRTVFVKDIINQISLTNVLDSSYFTAIDGEQESVRESFPPGNQSGTDEDKLKVLKTAIEGARFSNDINPNTNDTELIFTLNGKNFRIPYAFNRPPSSKGISFKLKGYSEKKVDLVEREIRNDLHKARINSLSNTPIGNYRDGVTIRTKEPGAKSEFNKNFNFNFADGGEFKLSIDPTAVGINMSLGTGQIRKNIDFSGQEAIDFMRVYKSVQLLENNPARLKAFKEKYPMYKDMNPRQISREIVREKIYENYVQERPDGYEDRKPVDIEQFSYGRRYSQGRGPSNVRMYTYPDGVNKELTAMEKDSIKRSNLEFFENYSDSSGIITTEPFEPYRFTQAELDAMAADEERMAQENTSPMIDPTVNDRRYVDQQGYIEPKDTNDPFEPYRFTNWEKQAMAQDDVSMNAANTALTAISQGTPQTFKPISLDSLGSEELNVVKEDTTNTILDSIPLEKRLEEIGNSSTEGGEDALNNIRQNPKVDEKLNSLGIEGDITPESLATDLSDYQYEVVDAETRESRMVDGVSGSEKMGLFSLPGQGDDKPEFMQDVDWFVDTKEVGGKTVSTGVIRKDNLVEFAQTPNATEVVKAAAGYAHMGYNNGSKLEGDTTTTSNIDCSGFTHSMLNTLGYDLSGNGQFKPTGELQVDKEGAPMYSGLLWHNSFNKKHFKKTSEIKLDQLKEGQIICFDLGLSDWEGEWRNQGNGQGIDHVGIVTLIKGVPYIQESSSNKNMQGPALMKLEDRLKQLSHRLDNPHYKRRLKTVPGEGEVLYNGKVYKGKPKLDKAGNPIYKTDKNNKFVLDANKKKIPILTKTGDPLGENTNILKPTIFIGEYKKKA